jgi:signal transduction histidine kinase
LSTPAQAIDAAAKKTGNGASWPGAAMERVVDIFAADYRRPLGPVLIAAVLTAAAVLESNRPFSPFSPTVALVFGVLATAPIAVIRRFPLAAISLVLTANAAFVVLARLSWSVAAVAGWLLTLAACPVVWPRRRAMAAVALTEIAVLLGVIGLNRNATPWDATAAEALAVLAAWGAGEMVRARRQSAFEQAAVAEQVRELRERDAVARERANIARELHDVVAHHVSMIAVRAATVPYSVPDLSEPGRAAFDEIAEEARTALTELRVVLGVLRAQDGAVPGPAPQPRIADLTGLVDRMTSAGMEVTLRVTGPVRPLPGSTELCCYRVVQEALTNAGRHARGSAVRVTVTFREETISCTIVNSTATVGPGPRSGGERGGGSRGSSPFGQHGLGLTGLRERVAMLQGVFEASPNQPGGFTVHAVLPAPPASGAAPQATQ